MVRRDFIGTEFVNWGRRPVILAPDQLLESFPELFEGRNILLAHIEERELFSVEFKVRLLLVDACLALSQLF